MTTHLLEAPAPRPTLTVSANKTEDPSEHKRICGEWWAPLAHHPVQQQFVRSRKRFNIVPAGRRSGKTRIAKRRAVIRGLEYEGRAPGRIVFGGPTFRQAEDIFWDDLKAAVPKSLRAFKPSESKLTIQLINGITLQVTGLDVPARIEGDPPIIGVLLDEFGSMRGDVWGEHLRPALSETLGWADFIGVPEGRNHYFDLFDQALHDDTDEWAAFTWITAEVLPLYLGVEAAAKEIAAAKRDLDPLTYKQEYEAGFVTFEGRAYYTWLSEKYAQVGLSKLYNPGEPLIFCFDFNVAPGVAAVIQEKHMPRVKGLPDALDGTRSVVIGEVYIERASNTPQVCDRLVNAWGGHKGEVLCYGDATGGAKGTAKVRGSDWDLIETELVSRYGNQVVMMNERSNPRERVRVNAVNSRTHQGRLLVDPETAPKTVRDLEGVSLKRNGSGEIDKEEDSRLTHISDGIGYYVQSEYPIDALAANEISREIGR